MIEACHDKGLPAIIGDLNNFTTDRTFDNIFLPFHTIGYTDNVFKTCENLKKLLNPGGILIVSAVNTFNPSNVFALRFSRTNSYPVTRGSNEMLTTQTMSFFDRMRLSRLFQSVKVYGRSSLSYSPYDNWKDYILRLFPFFDKSLYFICGTSKTPLV